MVRAFPPVAEVVAGSTPVVSFGNPHIARFVTLGINPSRAEFLGPVPSPNRKSNGDAGIGPLLADGERRLATLESLGNTSTATLTDQQVRTLVEECWGYFGRNPYHQWFRPLDRILQKGLGVSYYDGTAAHLDLSPWATSPTWRDLDETSKKRLLDAGVPHLKKQLQAAKPELVICNGRSVIDQIRASRLAAMDCVGKLEASTGQRLVCDLFRGQRDGTRFVGWSTNIQSSWGVTRKLKDEIAGWLAQWKAQTSATTVSDGKEGVFSMNGNHHIPHGTRVTSKGDLVRLLDNWYANSDETTIGDVRSYGRSPCVHIDMPGIPRMVLNADTKRGAVKAYLDETGLQGANAAWFVGANRNQIVNKVSFRPDGRTQPGWYCYTREPLPAPCRI